MQPSLPAPSPEARAHSERLSAFIRDDIAAHGGWIPFSRFMELALYAPGLGYYAAGARKFGEAGDFITAPELSPLFGRTLARQVAEIMAESAPRILELGAGSGKLAVDLLGELERLDALPERYSILEVSADLRERQQKLVREKLPHVFEQVEWLNALPEKIEGAVIGNEVLDALPVEVVQWLPSPLVREGRGRGDAPHLSSRPLSPTPLPRGERGNIILQRGVTTQNDGFVWQDRPAENALLDAARQLDLSGDYLSEISLATRGLIRTLCERLHRGVLLFIDYGFGAREYYHPQRDQGTLMCHYRHRAHADPFFLPGLQDITAHVDFTAVHDSAIASGAHLLGYTSQAHFLINCGIGDFLTASDPENLRAHLPLSAQLQKLTSPAEMGELFKVIALGKGIETPLLGFMRGDLSRLL
ncbi:MAG: SAM-dependent methyltransferase [Gallionellaceae bacterium]|jgi:SAM-dependent MidA family methyltransferase|nr:SAM-dependent methyltransferase [Gallionellaceae bacterium]